MIRIPHREAANHNGGQVQFGPDGYLYLATGDGGGGGDPPENAQNLDVAARQADPDRPAAQGRPALHGPRLEPVRRRRPGATRSTPTGSATPTASPSTARDGHLMIGDVGQDSWEEIDYLSPAAARGANFGWDAYEGFGPFDSSRRQPDPRPGR